MRSPTPRRSTAISARSTSSRCTTLGCSSRRTTTRRCGSPRSTTSRSVPDQTPMFCRVSAPARCACAVSTGRRSSSFRCARCTSFGGRGHSSTSRASSGWRRPRNGFASAEPRPEPAAMTVPTDEIYEKYRDKAIVEINALGDEIGRTANGRVPVLGSGHPLGDVLLLKYRPQPSEVQEGVAFFGRAGQAILKSLQRLHVDPMAVYGTNCLKFAEGEEEESRPFLSRELHIVQPKLVVPMGEQAVEFLNSVQFPLADRLEWKPEGRLQRFTATVDALVVPDIDGSLDE